MSKINKQDLLEIKYTLKIYIRIIFYIDNLFLIKNRSLTSSEGENVSDALIQHGLFRRAYDQINSYSFTQFMLQNMFTKICSESHTGKCDEYDELSKLFKNIGLNTNDIKTIKTKLFKVLDEINARITQSERVKAMKAKIKKLIEDLNEQKNVETILNKIKELLGEKGADGQPLMEDQKLQALINDIFTNIESGQDEGGLNRLGAGRGKERDPTQSSSANTQADQGSQTELQTQNQATGTSENPEQPQPPVNDTTDANLIAAALLANMDKQPPAPAPAPEPPEKPVNDTTDANLIAAALLANMDNQPQGEPPKLPEPAPEPPPAQPPVNDTTDANLIAAALIANMDNQPPPAPPEPPAPPPVNDTTDANLIAAALIANMDNQPPAPPAEPPAPPAEPPAPPAPPAPAEAAAKPPAPTEAEAEAIKTYNDNIGVNKLTDSKLYKSLVDALHNNNEKIFKDAMDKTHYENLKELRDKYYDIVEHNYPNNKSKMDEEFYTLLENKIASIINPQPKVSGGQNKSKKTKKSKKKNKKTRKKKIVSNLKYNFVMKKETL